MEKVKIIFFGKKKKKITGYEENLNKAENLNRQNVVTTIYVGVQGDLIPPPKRNKGLSYTSDIKCKLQILLFMVSYLHGRFLMVGYPLP